MVIGSDGVLAAGLSGLQRGIRQANTAAQDIASANLLPAQDALAQTQQGSEGADSLASLSESMVELIVAEQQVAASAAVIKTSDEMLGHLIDIVV